VSYLTPPPATLQPERLKSTTNTLEGGINAEVKRLANTHRGLTLEHQRRMIDWWLSQNTTAWRPARDRKAVQLGSRPTRQSQRLDPQRKPHQPATWSANPLRPGCQCWIHTLNRCPERPDL